MTSDPTFLRAVAAEVRAAGEYNRNEQIEPAAILWPDKERQWEPLLPQLRAVLPLLTLGPYDPAARSGPSYWVRCALARTLEDVDLPVGEPAVVYLPGVARADIRAVDECPAELQPLAELQYRGVIWTHKNGRDWTVAGFLSSADGGLGIDVAGDNETREALLRARVALADVPLSRLRREAPLRASFFNTLMIADVPRALLRWLDDPEVFRTSLMPGIWDAFRGICVADYGFDPETGGALIAASLLGTREGAWPVVWERFAESPRAYPGIPARLRAAHRQPQLPLFYHPDSWPDENERREAELRHTLAALRDQHPDAARVALRDLEAHHGPRRSWVWGELGEAPLATALRHLHDLAATTARPLGGATITAIATTYTAHGWQADDAALRALAAVSRQEDSDAVAAAIEALYRTWLEASATEFQAAVRSEQPAYGAAAPPPPSTPPGTCLLFSDALRYDVAQRLAGLLQQRGLSPSLSWGLAALPPVTSTAKPAVAPVASQLRGADDFNTAVQATGSKVTAEMLRRLLAMAGYQDLRGTATGDPSGRGWTELGEIDAYGHEHGVRLARHVVQEVADLAERVEALLAAGWQRVVIVTDHGWLLLPEGLPKVELPAHLTEVRKGRCARLKPNADTGLQTVGWRWDEHVNVAIAPGIGCFEAGKQYEHGGLSPQECIIPVLTVVAATVVESVAIEAIVWRGLRCRAILRHAPVGAVVDIRLQPGSPATSLVARPARPDDDGLAAPLVEDDDYLGRDVYVVVLSESGAVLTQQPTIVGE